MNRPIKFRAWQDGGMYFDVSTNGLRVWWGTSIAGGDEYSLPFAEVKLMQFTGLLDKNGKGIYEGDIVNGQDQDSKNAVVKFLDGSFVFWARAEQSPCQEWYITNNSIEIIGNIYETPDLLTPKP